MKITIIAIVVSPDSVVLYKPDGEAITIAQGNITSPQLVTQAIADIQKNKVAVIDLTPSEIGEGFSIYEKTSGVAKFFRVAKSYIDKLFGENGTLVPQQVGDIPETPPENEESDGEGNDVDELPPIFNKEPEPLPEGEDAPEIAKAPEPPKQQSKRKHRAAIREIMGEEEETLPAKSSSLDKSKLEEESVTVAIVGDTIIPHAEKIQKQVEHAVSTNRTQGMDNLLKRLSVMIHERSHSTEDLVAFLSTGDLPVMDDGSILAYKRVESTQESGVYVDSHSGKVRQGVGSEVMMAITHVDPSRSQSCSYGLHVATRGYLRSFHGDTILFIKVAPEDAIAVPSHQNTKIRVCRYQIIGKASPTMFSALIRNTPITGEKETKVIANLLVGNHPPMTQRVLLNSRDSTDITYTPITETETPVSNVGIPTETMIPDSPVETELQEHTPEVSLHSVDARSAVTKKKPLPCCDPKPVEETPSKEEVSQQLVDTVSEIAKSKEKPAKKKPVKKTPAKQKTTKPKKTVSPSVGKKPPTAREMLHRLLPVKTKAQAQEALFLKRKTKKGWSALGVSSEDEAVIMNLLKK